MTTKTTIEVKSRRAHSTYLAVSEREHLFDTSEFCTAFDILNPDLTVWDAEKGVKE